jgi:hypothetical protein
MAKITKPMPIMDALTRSQTGVRVIASHMAKRPINVFRVRRGSRHSEKLEEITLAFAYVLEPTDAFQSSEQFHIFKQVMSHDHLITTKGRVSRIDLLLGNLHEVRHIF